MQVDIEEKENQMCSKCKVEINDNNKCIRCGDKLLDNSSSINIGFDEDKFKKLVGDD